MTRGCLVDGCLRPHKAKGLCGTHYEHLRRTGSPERRIISFGERFWSHVDRSALCWLWTGSIAPSGYGQFNIGKKRPIGAHRVAYWLTVGAVPAGFQLDHLCRTRACVNPAHLEAVTQRENNLRSDSPTAVNLRKTHCPSGHPYDQSNTYVTPNGWRQCVTCRHMRQVAA